MGDNFLIHWEPDYELYKYEKGELISYKDLTTLYKNVCVEDICPLTENEYVLFSRKKRANSGEICFVIFYDMLNNKKIRTLKIGKGRIYLSVMFLLNEDNLITSGKNFIVVIDVKDRIVVNKYNYNIFFERVILLNKNSFLHCTEENIYLYEIENMNKIRLIEKKDMKIGSITKYSKNKFIIKHLNGKKISIYGYN